MVALRAAAKHAAMYGLALLAASGATSGCAARAPTAPSTCPALASGRGGPLLSTQCHPQLRGGYSWTFMGELQADGAGLLLTGTSVTSTELNGVPATPEGIYAASLSPRGEARWLRQLGRPRRDGFPPFAVGPDTLDVLDGDGQRVTLEAIARGSGGSSGPVPLTFVYPGVVSDAVDTGDGLFVAASRALPTDAHERFVARIDRRGSLLWRTAPIPEATHVTVGAGGMVLASTLTKSGWSISVVDPRGAVVMTGNVPGEARSPEYAYGRRVGRVVASANGWVLAGPVGEQAIEAVILGPFGNVLVRRKLVTPPSCYGLQVPDTGCLNDYAVDAAGALAWTGRTSYRDGFLTFVGPTQGWTHTFAAPNDPLVEQVIPWRLAFDGRGGLAVVGGVVTHDPKTYESTKALFFAQFRGN